MDAHCSPRTCSNSAIDARTRRRNSETINSCVGSAMERVPLEAAWIATVVIGVPIIHGFQRQGEKIYVMNRGTRKDTSSPIWEDMLAFKYATFYAHNAHNRSPSVDDRSGWEQGGAQGEEDSVLSPGLLRLCCAASLYLPGGVGAGRNTHQSSSFSCVTIPRIWACRCVASSFWLRLNVARGRLKSIAVKVSKPKRAFFTTIEKRCVTQSSEPRSGWVRIRYTCREWLFLTSLHISPWMPTLST